MVGRTHATLGASAEMSTAARAGCRRSDALYNGITVFPFNRTDVPVLADAAVVFALAVIASLVGARIGRALQVGLTEPDRAQLLGIEASLLGLLALLLGFSFGMGQTRYEARRVLVIDEANAIGTSWLRTAAAPEPRRLRDPGAAREICRESPGHRAHARRCRRHRGDGSVGAGAA